MVGKICVERNWKDEVFVKVLEYYSLHALNCSKIKIYPGRIVHALKYIDEKTNDLALLYWRKTGVVSEKVISYQEAFSTKAINNTQLPISLHVENLYTLARFP